nr:restriction endonuclease subunit S [Xanthomonas arboricola]
MSELPQGWAFASLNELQAQGGIFADGDWIESKDQDPNGRNRLLQLADIGDGRFIDKSSRYVNDETFDRLNCTALEDGDILLARMPDPLGRACLMPRLPQRCLTVVDVAVFRSGSRDISHRWLMHTLNASPIREEISRNASGTTRKRIARGKLAELKVPVPPAAEQKRIAQKLDALLTQVDTLKARIDAMPALLKRFRQSVLISAMRGDWSHALGTWKRSTIGELGNVVTGSTPPTTDKKNYGGDVCFFKPSDLNAGYKAWNSAEKLSEAGASCTRRIPALAVMVTCIGATIGKTGLARSAGATNQQINSVICDQESVMPEWLYLWFISPAGQAAVIGNAAATTLPILNKSKFSALQLSLPLLGEQGEIVRRVEQLFAYADQLEAKVATAQQRINTMTQSLLAKAFRGELVPQDPSDEPASVLLERIRTQRAATPKPKRGRKAATS